MTDVTSMKKWKKIHKKDKDTEMWSGATSLIGKASSNKSSGLRKQRLFVPEHRWNPQGSDGKIFKRERQ